MMRFLLTVSLFSVLIPLAGAEDHWAYLPPAAPSVAVGEGTNPIDAILDKARKDAGIVPAKLAPPENWVRRAAYTLTGLPPSQAQIERIRSNPDEATWRALIEEFLASPAYGERWARHWMDVARYADTRGYNFDQDNRYPFAYTYRDWLINAFNNDLPYPEFIKLQIAADHLTDRPDHPDLAALGFLTVGPRAGNLETVDDRVDVVTRGFLASTVSCARCHKHKSDPITMDDYYSLYSIFENTTEPEIKPVIGEPADSNAYDSYLAEVAKLEDTDRNERQKIVNHLRDPESLGAYLELAWSAKMEAWDEGKATSEAFRKGRHRAKAVMKWKEFLEPIAWGGNTVPRLVEWANEMEKANPSDRIRISRALADEWLAAPEGSDLRKLAAEGNCPLNYDISRISEFFDQEDGNANRKRQGDLTALQISHPGSPPRAMSLADKDTWAPAQIFKRGDPSNRGEPIERRWLGFLGGGAFPEGKSPRLSLAEKIAEPSNPLTSRVMVNRIWAWHFNSHLADPGDFGVQHAPPALLPLLDFLALRFNETGGSVKDLHRLILTSRTFRLSADGPAENNRIDEANSHFWKWNRTRADFESARDRILATSGILDTRRTGGKSIVLEDNSADSRRSVYAFIDRYHLATTFVSFDVPHPDHHAPKRVETTVPQQALFLLNSPLLIRRAESLANDPAFRKLADDTSRIGWIYEKVHQRTPTQAETKDALEWLSATDPADYAPRLNGRWEVLYARDENGTLSEETKFPLFMDNSWRTGPDLASSTIPWIHANPDGGHTADGYSLILRWRSTGNGEVKMMGDIKRTQKGGSILEWKISNDGKTLTTQTLLPDQASMISGDWIKVAAGSTVDFVLRAPENVNHCWVSWNLRILGRETPDSKPTDLGSFKDHFPTPNATAPEEKPGSPWVDLIQMLWASNEFNFID
ncbi:MAG: hypothetical protein RLZZ505_1386 [Verrucomicrobiota bacterium]|jgi:hypothetical protein